MPLFGAHMSIAGGCHNALLTAEAHGCETVQLFTKNASQWQGKALSDEDIATFKKHVKRTRLRCVTAHDSYLINLASPDAALYEKSLDAFVEEMRRAEALGLTYLVMHPGAAVGDTPEAGLTRVAAALDTAHERCPGYRLKVLLETTAGQGTTLGHRFEHLAAILKAVATPRRLGVCLDTCHVFAAGYGLSSPAEYAATFREFDRVVGLKWLKLFHVNDSVKGLGCRVDRHAGLGLGQIGLEAFRLLVNDARFAAHPMILETPKEDGANKEMDRVNLGLLRELAQGNRSTTGIEPTVKPSRTRGMRSAG
jgi:deoxyribonuclease-4